MSRVARMPVIIPNGVKVNLNGQKIIIIGNRGQLAYMINTAVAVFKEDNNKLIFSVHEKNTDLTYANAQAGTARALVNNMVIGVVNGFEKKLLLKGVGYRASVKGNRLVLMLGFSHPLNYIFPKEIQIECPSQTEIVITGCDKQLVGQVAANIRSYRKPEPYKGKGIRYVDEMIRTKEAKKK
ncbi:50S ribosomal protein L6 [Candidatus Photodesmus katoptron]|uniref:Large ribosomal subunit protein uL6 n=1 Tax=Candidatus Photodesmus katoptron Akat1 TaxID=1236703 RepID=S3EGD2_9GAMM|nr:50S ribosomal protein L6 [Candidatus Photodesmus katoptron]EPE37228.1 ribosomal protein L6 [Candidatus Photodesmus katoptron Akat1]KEY90117.1 50S ribosomal protein L6 [Candidatus Photodesmus katoptron]